MCPDNDSIPPLESDGAVLANQTHIESADAAARGGLLRASVVERDLAEASPLAVIVAWVRQFLARPHAELGRSGPVCPFTPLALGLDAIWLTENTDPDPSREHIVEMVGRYRELFLEIEPRSGQMAINKAILIVFPQLASDDTALIDEVQHTLKASFVELGLMLGEFHAGNQSPGLRNPEFRPLRSPIPMLAIRYMVESDLPFLKREIDPPEVRASYLRSYLRRLGGTMSRKCFEQALAALVEAELQMRGATASSAEGDGAPDTST